MAATMASLLGEPRNTPHRRVSTDNNPAAATENFTDDMADALVPLRLMERVGASAEDRATALRAQQIFDADTRAEVYIKC